MTTIDRELTHAFVAARMYLRRRQHADLEKKLADLDISIERLRAMCPHLETRHHARPCAEAESWRECVLCGSEVRR